MKTISLRALYWDLATESIRSWRAGDRPLPDAVAEAVRWARLALSTPSESRLPVGEGLGRALGQTSYDPEGGVEA